MVLKDYPEIENEWGFAQPDPRVLPVCVGEVESTGHANGEGQCWRQLPSVREYEKNCYGYGV